MFTFFSKPEKKLIFKDNTAIIFGTEGELKLNIEGQLSSYTTKDKHVFTNDQGEKVVEVTGAATDGRFDRSWALATFDKGSASTNHFHKERTEIYYVTYGIARVVLDGVEHIVKEGEAIEINRNQHHQVFNVSDEAGLEILVKCTPAWVFQDMNIVEPVANTSSAPGPK
jgi:mannose-6-phosphate isomerase-like protein (cupin superfamily)